MLSRNRSLAATATLALVRATASGLDRRGHGPL